MCGRYEFLLNKQMLLDYYPIQEVDESYTYEERGEVFPSQLCTVILPEYRLTQFKWGLDEAWAKRAIINTRLETADHKRTTAQAFQQRRCIVPVSAFFEWNPDKDKIQISMEDRGIVSLAGVYNYYEDETGATYGGFSILTQDANQQVAPIHHRMPVVLPEDFADRYLDLSTNTEALKKSLLRFNHSFEFQTV